ncbi:MAG TPA: prolyl oligopeptidase family serine peptidase, partial [Bacteroidota bacterium]
NGEAFTWESERDGWRHVYTVSRTDGAVHCITPWPLDVIQLLKVDEQEGWLYFIASPENPSQRYLYRSKLTGEGSPERLSPANLPGTHTYDISPDGRWAFHRYSTLTTPWVTFLVHLPDHRAVRVLADNARLAAKVKALRWGPVSFTRVDIGGGVRLDAWRMNPPGFDPTRKYPLLMHVYGEPAAQTVLDQWSSQTLWHLLLNQKGYIVMSVDNRGTPAPRGRAWRKCIYRQIGVLASADQAAALRSILAADQSIDPGRVGIWGWSGGGSMSLNAIFRYPELYQTAVAVASVPDQRLYDSIYQERYMETPEDNPEGYRDGSPITWAHQLKGDLLLIHGTGDDNVHYQGAERLVNELIKDNKQFTFMPYPNRSHGIYEGPGTTLHLFTLITDYLAEHLPTGASPKALASPVSGPRSH